jgi:hypothetical protein
MKKKLLLGVLIATFQPVAAQQFVITTVRSGWVSPKSEPAAAPTIAWQTPQLRQGIEYRPTVAVTVRVQSADTLRGIQFFCNGQEVPRRSRSVIRVKGGLTVSETIPLNVGTNEMYVRAANAVGSTQSESRFIQYQPEVPASGVPVAGQKRLALVVANGNYGKYPLRNPTNDGRAVRQELERVGFTVVYRENLPLRELKQAFDAFVTDLGSHNVGLFYYAGHGLMVGGENYVQPVDANPKGEADVEFDCYPLRQLVARMAEVNAKGANLIFWDACRNNPYRSWRRGAGERTFAPLSPPVGTLLVFATEPGKQAYDGDEENGLFTSELVKHISQPNVDVNELLDRIEQGLEDRGFRQPPYPEGRLRGRFIFKTE